MVFGRFEVFSLRFSECRRTQSPVGGHVGWTFLSDVRLNENTTGRNAHPTFCKGKGGDHLVSGNDSPVDTA